MTPHSTPPVAQTLLEAMRAIGYSFETAIADLVDNSIVVGCTRLQLLFSPFGEPYVALADDGRGMSRAELLAAMQHGSRNPLAVRDRHDLGRFGLGLKTASLSQCRQLTVLSKQGGVLSGAEWNLDVVKDTKDWTLLELDPEDLDAVPGIETLESCQSGTLVVWRSLDRALAGESDPVRALQDHVDRTRFHLSLVFHRFMEGATPDFSLAINGVRVEPLDPFLRNGRGRQAFPPETLLVSGEKVIVEAHILPHISRLTQAEIAQAGGEDGLRRNQGFYVYRNRRLISWGTWFRLAKHEEMTKLARVLVDIPNSLDHLWSLDIKKSTAHPPEQVRRALRQIVDRIAERSRRVYTYRGRTALERDVVPGWQRLELRGGRFQYRINRDHDLFNAMRETVPEESAGLLERFVQMVEESFPYEAVYADMAADRQPASDETEEQAAERLRDMAQRLLDALAHLPEARLATLERLPQLEPFCRHPEIARSLKETLS
jgi:hypothetical protein